MRKKEKKLKKPYNETRERFKMKGDNSGFTLVELLVAIAILTLVVFPTMQVFVTATKANSKARTELQATISANSVLESAKAHSIFVFDKQCTTTYTAANADEFSLLAGTTTNSFVSSAYGGSVEPITLDGTVVKKADDTYTFVQEADQYAYAINGIRQSSNRYDAVIVFEKQDYRDVTIHSSGTKFTESQVGGIYGAYNKVYGISIYVYRHEDTPLYLNKDLASDSGALVEITGSKFDSARSF